MVMCQGEGAGSSQVMGAAVGMGGDGYRCHHGSGCCHEDGGRREVRGAAVGMVQPQEGCYGFQGFSQLPAPVMGMYKWDKS